MTTPSALSIANGLSVLALTSVLASCSVPPSRSSFESAPTTASNSGDAENADATAADGGQKSGDGTAAGSSTYAASAASAQVPGTTPSAPVPSAATVSQLITKDYAGLSGNKGDIIYATIDHLSQDQSQSANLEVVRFGMTKALNSVSMAPNIVAL